MSEDVARAVGAADPHNGVKIGDKWAVPGPLSIRELTELERACVSSFRRSYVQSFIDMQDLIPDRGGEGYIEKKVETAAKFDLQTLPPKHKVDQAKIPYCEKMAAWLLENMDGYAEFLAFADEPGDTEAQKQDKKLKRYQILAGAALNSGMMAESTYEELVGLPPKKNKIPYVHWWINATFEGRSAMTWQCLVDSGITKAEFDNAIKNNPAILLELAKRIEDYSVPQTGNG